MNIDKNIRPFNSKGQCHGYWESYWIDGELYYKCVYHNGKRIGYEIDYNYNGEKIIKRYNI